MYAQSQFHTHVAFPDSLRDKCQQFVQANPSWKMGQISEVYFPNDPGLHEKHVVRGTCHVLTIKTPTFGDALEHARCAFDALSSKEQIRLEIEQILKVNGQPLAYEFIELKERPTFESHIVITRKCGGSIKDAALYTLALQLGIRFDMYDLIAEDTKGTITAYYTDPTRMELETSANLAKLSENLSFVATFNTKLERVLFSGPLNTLPEWLNKHQLTRDS
jgi:hypothetical protein